MHIEKFLEWLPTKFEEFQGKNPEEVAQTLNEMYETTDEGKQTIETLINTFAQEQQSADSKKFYTGGKLTYLMDFYKKGGSTKSCDCGCPLHHVMEKGGVIEKCACGCKSSKIAIARNGFALDKDMNKDLIVKKKKMIKVPLSKWNKMTS